MTPAHMEVNIGERDDRKNAFFVHVSIILLHVSFKATIEIMPDADPQNLLKVTPGLAR